MTIKLVLFVQQILPWAYSLNRYYLNKSASHAAGDLGGERLRRKYQCSVLEGESTLEGCQGHLWFSRGILKSRDQSCRQPWNACVGPVECFHMPSVASVCSDLSKD